jgi:hypothetical protein
MTGRFAPRMRSTARDRSASEGADVDAAFIAIDGTSINCA